MPEEKGFLCRTFQDSRIPARFQGSGAGGLEDVRLVGSRSRRSRLPPTVPHRFLPERRKVVSLEVLKQQVEGDARVPTRFLTKSLGELQGQSSQKFETFVRQKVNKLTPEEKDPKPDIKHEEIPESGDRIFNQSQYDQQNEKGI